MTIKDSNSDCDLNHRKKCDIDNKPHKRSSSRRRSKKESKKHSRRKSRPHFVDPESDSISRTDDLNSGDEHESRFSPIMDREQSFEKSLSQTHGFTIKKMKNDGSCLFRAISDQIYGDPEMHDVVRSNCLNYILKNSDHFSNFITEDIISYVERKRRPDCYGNHIEIQALSELFDRPVEIYHYSPAPMKFGSPVPGKSKTFPIRLSYHDGQHYNSVVDLKNPGVGVGLGLPGYHPEKPMLDEVENQIVKDKILTTDWEVTEAELMEQAKRDSLNEFYSNERNRSLVYSSLATNQSTRTFNSGPMLNSSTQNLTTTTIFASKPQTESFPSIDHNISENQMVSSKESSSTSKLSQSSHLPNMTATFDQ